MTSKTRERLFRVLAAAVVVLMIVAVLMDVQSGASELVGDVTMLFFTSVLGILFATYAALGPPVANRLLARLLWIQKLPELVLDKTIGRFVEVPTIDDPDVGEQGGVHSDPGGG